MATLSLVLGGTAFAAATATHTDAKADTKLVKKLAPALSVKHAKTADSATNATNATHAAAATSATTAANANALGGQPASFYAPSHGYSTGFTDSNPVTLTSAGEVHTLMTLNVPSGAYIVIARLQGITGGDGGGNNFRYDCTLAGSSAVIDDPIYRVGETDFVENYLTYEGGYSGAGPITLSCRSANTHTLTADSGSMVAIKVGGLN